MAQTDFTATTTEAAGRIYEATREAYVAGLDAALTYNERAGRLARAWADEAKAASADDKALRETLRERLTETQEAGQQLVQSYLAAGLSSLYFPFAVADRVFRPQAAQTA
ncbi:MAG: hypothetical protein QOD86_1477 [Miltoncostaeaceae bacterium]|jgi:hypothetical protein|nr:hypothetical protein [Miltoncostaeaceae bacterium]